MSPVMKELTDHLLKKIKEASDAGEAHAWATVLTEVTGVIMPLRSFGLINNEDPQS
jgi:hypothetical protein